MRRYINRIFYFREAAMQPKIHLFLCDDSGERFFGEGPYRLLCTIKQTGSLRSAASEMGMAYTKALKIIQRAEANLGYALIERKTGGKGGGGSQLTLQVKELMHQYEIYKLRCHEANLRIFTECFPGQ